MDLGDRLVRSRSSLARGRGRRDRQPDLWTNLARSHAAWSSTGAPQHTPCTESRSGRVIADEDLRFAAGVPTAGHARQPAAVVEAACRDLEAERDSAGDVTPSQRASRLAPSVSILAASVLDTLAVYREQYIGHVDGIAAFAGRACGFFLDGTTDHEPAGLASQDRDRS